MNDERQLQPDEERESASSAKEPYQPPKVESVRLTQEAAEALT